MPLLSFLTSSKNKTSNYLLAVNRTSRNFKSLLLRSNSDASNVEIVGVSRKSLVSDTDGKVPSSYEIDILNEVLSEVLADAEEKVDGIYWLCGGTESLGLMTTAKLNRGNKGEVSKKELESMYAQTVDASLVRAHSEMLQLKGNFSEDLRLLDSSVITTTLDDIEVSNPVGKSGSLIKMSVFTSYAMENYVRELLGISKKVKLDAIEIDHELFPFTNCLESTEFENSNYVIIHGDFDYTSIGVVFGKGIVATKVIPIGYLSFVEELSQELGITFKSAEKMLNNYSSGSLSESENAIVSDNLVDVLDIWLSGLSLAFTEFTGVKTFAHNIYLVGECFNISDLYGAVVTEPWTKSIPFKQPPEFKKLTVADIPNISDNLGKASSSEWVLLASLGYKMLKKVSSNLQND